MSVAHVSETDRTGTNYGDRLLSVWLKPFIYGQKSFRLSTYSMAKGPDEGKDIPIIMD